MKKWIYWNGPGMESHFSIDGPLIHESVAPLQLPDGHHQFRSSAGPVYFTSICHIFQLYLLIPTFAFAAQPTSATSVMMLWRRQRSNSFSTVFVTICNSISCWWWFEFACLISPPPVQMVGVFFGWKLRHISSLSAIVKVPVIIFTGRS